MEVQRFATQRLWLRAGFRSLPHTRGCGGPGVLASFAAVTPAESAHQGTVPRTLDRTPVRADLLKPLTGLQNCARLVFAE